MATARKWAPAVILLRREERGGRRSDGGTRDRRKVELGFRARRAVRLKRRGAGQVAVRAMATASLLFAGKGEEDDDVDRKGVVAVYSFWNWAELGRVLRVRVRGRGREETGR
jgi:hypothetical protein